MRDSVPPTAGGINEIPMPTEDGPTGPNRNEPNTQGRTSRRRDRWPAWMQQLPVLHFRPEEPDIHAPLIDVVELEQVLAAADPAALERIKADIRFLDYELLRLFRERDHAAKKQQNRYRKYQIIYVILAAIATTVGGFQALALASNPEILPWFAFIETGIALSATFLATVSGRESPLPLWLNNRRRAESMRREYFRYIVNLPPYDAAQGYQRQMLLSKRAADINRGVFPDEPTVS